MGLPPSTRVNKHFISISLLSDCWYGAKDEETPSEQRVSVERESQARTPKACPSTQKTHPCEKRVSSLKDISHLTELQAIYPGQKPHLGGVSRGTGSVKTLTSTKSMAVERKSSKWIQTGPRL